MKICIAGTNAYREAAEKHRPKFILESFYYFHDWQVEFIKKSELFLLDSGAFTFMNNFKGTVDWDEYIERYAAFINKYDVKYFFELDIDSVVGLTEVKRLRKKLEDLTHKKCIPVWHKSRGLEEWYDICKNYDYVAIGGIVIKEITRKDYKYFNPLLDIARKYNTKVHGLGLTITKELKKYPFYSVDSTSWVNASKFGQLQIFKDASIKSIQRPENTRVLDGGKAVEFTLKEWIKFQEYAECNL